MSFNAADRLAKMNQRKLETPRETSLVSIATPTPRTNSENDRSDTYDRGTINVDSQINGEVKAWAATNHCSRDTFYEACWIVLKNDPNLLATIAEIAADRHTARRRAGTHKRVATLMKNLNTTELES